MARVSGREWARRIDDKVAEALGVDAWALTFVGLVRQVQR